MIDDIATECIVCKSHINAGSYPPVCSDSCKKEWLLECEFSTWAEKQIVLEEK